MVDKQKYLFQVYKEDSGIRYMYLDPISYRYTASVEEHFLSWDEVKCAKRAFKKWSGYHASIILVRTLYKTIEEDV